MIDVGRAADPGRHPSRSPADFAVACSMVRAGFNDDEIIAVSADHPHGVGERYAACGWAYLRHVLKGARTKAGAA